MLLYTKEKDSFILRDTEDQRIVHSFKGELGIFYIKKSLGCSLQKVGEYSEIEQHYNYYVKTLSNNNASLTSSAVFINATSADIKDINYLLNHSQVEEKYFLKIQNNSAHQNA